MDRTQQRLAALRQRRAALRAQEALERQRIARLQQACPHAEVAFERVASGIETPVAGAYRAVVGAARCLACSAVVPTCPRCGQHPVDFARVGEGHEAGVAAAMARYFGPAANGGRGQELWRAQCPRCGFQAVELRARDAAP